MKIVVSGSLDFAMDILSLKLKLEEHGHKVVIPISIADNGVEPNAQLRKDILQDFFADIEKSEALLIANFDKSSTENYIGPATFAEAVVAFYLGKSLYLLNPIPDLPLKEELEAMSPSILHGDLSKLQK